MESPWPSERGDSFVLPLWMEAMAEPLGGRRRASLDAPARKTAEMGFAIAPVEIDFDAAAGFQSVDVALGPVVR